MGGRLRLGVQELRRRRAVRHRRAGIRIARADDLGADDPRRQGRDRSGPRHRHPALPDAPAGPADLDQSDRVDLRLDAGAGAPREPGQYSSGCRIRRNVGAGLRPDRAERSDDHGPGAAGRPGPEVADHRRVPRRTGRRPSAGHDPMNRVVIVGGGPGGYEAALVAAQLDANVTVVDRDGLGGSAVLTDCVPSKTLIATAELMTSIEESRELGVGYGDAENLDAVASVDLAKINARVQRLAMQQSEDIAGKLDAEGIRVIRGTGRLDGRDAVTATTSDGGVEAIPADVVLLATGAQPRVLPTAPPDGERILTWEQVYDLAELPDRLIVVGSGVTGAEFASAYDALGAAVVLVSSRDRVLPSEDADAAYVLEEVFTRRGLTVVSRSRA